MSLTFRGMNLVIDFGSHRSLFQSRNPLLTSLLTMSMVGAVIQSPPVGILLGNPLYRYLFTEPLSEAILLIITERKRALSDLVLVMSVFSRDSFNLSSFFKKSPICFLSSMANFLLPQTPTSQSSAYLTYLILVTNGLGIVDLNRYLSLSTIFSFFLSIMLGFPSLTNLTIFFFSL